MFLKGDIAERMVQESAKPALAKRLHVLAALEIERHRKIATDIIQVKLSH
jgi:hypothetical protein